MNVDPGQGGRLDRDRRAVGQAAGGPDRNRGAHGRRRGVGGRGVVLGAGERSVRACRGRIGDRRRGGEWRRRWRSAVRNRWRADVLRVGHRPHHEVGRIVVGVRASSRPSRRAGVRCSTRTAGPQPAGPSSHALVAVAPADGVDRRGRALDAQRDAAAGGGHPARVDRIGDGGEGAGLVCNQQVSSRTEAGCAQPPSRRDG